MKMRVSPSSYYNSDNYNNNNNNNTNNTLTESNIYNRNNTKISSNKFTSSTDSKSKDFSTHPSSFPSSKKEKSACRIVEKGTEEGVVGFDYGNLLNTSGNSNINRNPISASISPRSTSQCTGISEVNPDNDFRHSSIIKPQQGSGPEELFHQGTSNRDTGKVQADQSSNCQRINCIVDSHNNNNSINANNNTIHHQGRNAHNPVAVNPRSCDIPRFILVPRTNIVDPNSSASTSTALDLKDSTLVTVTQLEEIEVEFSTEPSKGRSSLGLPPPSPGATGITGTTGLPLKKTFSHNTGTTESNTNTNTYTANTELRYSGSFNSKSTHFSNNYSVSFSFNQRDQDQDYSEEKRLLLLAESSNNNIGIHNHHNHHHHNSIRSYNSSNRNKSKNSNSGITHKRSHSFPQNNIIGIRRSTSNNTNPSAGGNISETHRFPKSSKESPLRGIYFSPPVTGAAALPLSSTSTSMTLTPHSNLGELLNASKKLQQEKAAAAAAAAGVGPGSGLGGRSRRATGGDNLNNSNHNSSKVSSPKSRPTLTRPSSLSSKSKSTGMYFSPQEHKYHSSSIAATGGTRNGSDVPLSSSAAILYSSSTSGSKTHVSRHSYSHAQSHAHHGHNRSHSLSINGSQGQNQSKGRGVQLVPQQNRPGIIKQSSTTGMIENSSSMATSTMNPFEDPSLVGDLHISSSGADATGGNFITNLNSAVGVHPLQSSILGTNSGSSGNMLQFDPLKITSSASSTSSRHEYPQKQRQHQPSPSIDTAQLSELAAALSSLKPQQPHNTECNNNFLNPQQLKLADHQVTLGHAPKESTGTSKSHRRFLSLRGPKSLNNDEMRGVMESMQQQPSGSGSFEYGGIGVAGSGSSDQYDITTSSSKDKKEKKHKRAASMGIFKRNDSSLHNEGVMGERPVTPIKALRRGRNSSSPNLSNGEDEDVSGRAGKSPSRRKRGIRLGAGKNQSRSVNTENNNGATPHHSPGRMSDQPLETIQSNESAGSGLYPAAQCCSSGGSPTSQIKLRSSEQDPSPHQIRIPSASDVLLQVKLCHLMEKYREIDQNFHFGVLVNISREEMEIFADLDKKSRPNSPIRSAASGGNSLSPPQESAIMKINPLTSPSPVTVSRLRNLVDAHKPIVQSIISSASDLILADFYYEKNQNENNITHDTTQDKPPGDRTEVAIFASDVLRQFIVVYQGSAECQAKPIRKRFTGKFKSNVAKNFRSDEEHLSVYPPFEQGYSQSGIEEKVFKKLDELAEQHPFFDVIVTGHSYGGMMALLGSMRYACSRPAMMVSCFAFGCPKVGALDFRHYVNSLPNLNVTRLEYGFDPWVHAPDNPTWTHAGHTISILPQMQSNKERKGGNEKANKDNNQNNNELFIRAYKFGNDRPDSAANGKFIGKKGNRQEKQIDHDISSYLNAIELITKEGASWPRQFVGEEGTGVRGMNKEKRLVC